MAAFSQLDENDLLNTKTILRILYETEKSEDKDRRRNAFNAYQVYSGNQKIYVERELQRTRPKSYEGYTISNISVSKMITDKRAQAFSENPIRSVEGSPEKSESLQMIYEQANAMRELPFLDVVYNLNRYSLMWVNYRMQEQRFQFMTLHPYEFVLVRHKDTGEVLIVGMNYPDLEITQEARSLNRVGNRSSTAGDGISDLIAESQVDSAAQGETWVFWSAQQHVKVRVSSVKDAVGKLKKNIEYVPIEGNPNNINPLGILPFVLVTADTSVDYPTVNPLTEQSVMFNVQQSETLTAKNVHGSGIQIFKYPEKMAGRFKKMTQGQMVAVELPQSSNPDDAATEFEYQASGAQINPMMDSDAAYLQQIFHEHGIENVNMEGGINLQSGVAKVVAGANVQKIIEKNQQIYADMERKMFKIIKAWDRLLGLRMFSEEDELTVVYPKPKVTVSDEDTLRNIKMMLELGLIEEWEKFIKMDPNLSEEEAREKLARIDERRRENARSVLGGNNGNNARRISEESEPGPEELILDGQTEG